MERTPLLPLPEGMFIDQIQEAEASLIITVIATLPVSCCPLCLEPSSSIHSLYRRTLADVPCGGRQIQLVLIVRKFFCRNPLCERKVFTERLPQFALPWARMTILVDLESHRVIDLLPDRRAETCAQWMRQRPEITAVSRDRGESMQKQRLKGLLRRFSIPIVFTSAKI